MCAVKDVVVSFNLPHFCVNSNLTVFGAEVSRVMSLCGERRGAGADIITPDYERIHYLQSTQFLVPANVTSHSVCSWGQP